MLEKISKERKLDAIYLAGLLAAACIPLVTTFIAIYVISQLK